MHTAGPDIIELRRGEIPEGSDQWVMVDIRRMAEPTTGGPRNADGGLTWYVDKDQPEDLVIAIHEAKLEARHRGIKIIYVRGRDA